MSAPAGPIHPFYIALVPFFAWGGTLIMLMVAWLATGRPIYPTEKGTFPLVSDIAASSIQPAFIVGCVITGVGFYFTLVIDGLRCTGILDAAGLSPAKVLSYLSIASGLGAGMGVMLLSIFNYQYHTFLHDTFTIIFVLGIIQSALFSSLEYHFLLTASPTSPLLSKPALQLSNGLRIAVVLLEISIIFAFCTTHLFELWNGSAVLEWLLALGFEMYLLTFCIDLHPANYVSAENVGGSVRLGGEE